jgi:hypothetical protein
MVNNYEITGETAAIINNWLLEGIRFNQSPFKVGDEVFSLLQELGKQRLSIIETLVVPEASRSGVGSAQWVKVFNTELNMSWDGGQNQWVVPGSESQFEKDHPSIFASNHFKKA